jgi:hypothetical protein
VLQIYKRLANFKNRKVCPRSRRVILDGGFMPDIVQHGPPERRNRVWDGLSARRSDGRQYFFPTPVRNELVRLALRGKWGDLSDTIIDISRYGQIRDQIDGKARYVRFLNVALWWPDRR